MPLSHARCTVLTDKSQLTSLECLRDSMADEDPDDMISDTRWVRLNNLLHLGDSELKALDIFAAKLQKAAKDARKRLRELEDDE